jgi:putative acetyltransferase
MYRLPQMGHQEPLTVTDAMIAVDDPRAHDVRALLRRPEDMHALDVSGLLDPAVTFLSCRRDGELLAIGALRQLGHRHAEIKSMHTAEAARGLGLGRAMLDRLIALARERGCTRVSLETGSMAAFGAARALYASAGFTECGPFADYTISVNSTFMTLLVDPAN